MLVTLSEILRDANERHYAVGAFNSLSVENVMGAIEAAERLRSPIILQLAEVQFPEAPLDLMAPLFLQAARKATVPVCVHLDHGQSLETCVKAIRLGFTSVMFDGAALPFEENVAVTREVTRIAKAAGVDVEAELGKVGDSGVDTADVFTDVKFIDVVGTSKGKGFQGVVKRHGFAGVGGQTHGQHNRLRHPGSMGASSWPSRVFPGMRMAGHMGAERVKVFNLEVLKLIPENNLIIVKGSVPGAKGSYLILED